MCSGGNMSWELPIREFKNTYTCTVLDQHGRIVPEEIKVTNYKKNMWLFDIAEGHVLDIEVRKTNRMSDHINDITATPTVVGDDLTYEIFYDDSKDDCTFGRVATLKKHGQYNAISLQRFLLGGKEPTPTIFALPRLHFEQISALNPPDANPFARRQINGMLDHYPPIPNIIPGRGFHYILTELDTHGEISPHKLTTAVVCPQEMCPPHFFCTAHVAAGNSLKIEIENLSHSDKIFEVTPTGPTLFKYPSYTLTLKRNEKKIVNTIALSKAYAALTISSAFLNDVGGEMGKSKFNVSLSEKAQKATDQIDFPMPAFVVPIIPARPVHPAILPSQPSSGVLIMKTNFKHIRTQQKIILSRLKMTHQINDEEFEILSLGI